jgi:hypothetical protein
VTEERGRKRNHALSPLPIEEEREGKKKIDVAYFFFFFFLLIGLILQ